MPIYEYVCEACQTHTERLQKIADPPLTDCPACGRPELKRLVSPAGFRLKGGGWYETDFKQSGKRNLAGETAGEAKPDGAAATEAGKKEKSLDKTAGAGTSTKTDMDKSAKAAALASVAAPS